MREIPAQVFREARLAAPVAPIRDTAYTRGLKRGMDLCVALVLLPVLVPLIGVLWALTRRDGGPGFYGHRRIGQGGRAFRCWKIRTMVPNAEAVLVTHLKANPDAAREWMRGYKLSDDPRVTPLGRVLRRTSLDELPQILNVLRGQMSFVGPRPVMAEELAKYGGHRRAYLSLRPGITGIWQLNGRNDVDYPARIAMDLDYSARVGPLLDLWLMLRTLGVVVQPTGR